MINKRRIILFWRRLIRRRLLQHTLFWGLSFYILLRLFAYNLEISRIDYIYTFLFHLSLWFAVYLNLLLAIPRLLRPGHYVWYGLSILLIWVGATAFNLLVFEKLADWIFPGYYFIAYYNFWDIAQFVAAYLLISALLKLSKGWFQLDIQKKKIARLEQQKLKAEMQALKAQIDPHFLLNTLNNLYSLALDQDTRTADLLLRLSQSMRYRLYECAEEEVPLQREIDFMQNYLELQRIRLGKQPDITWEINGTIAKKKIAPLLFTPFLENAFKHGLRGGSEKAYLHIELSVNKKKLFFKSENSKPSRANPAVFKKSSGIGLPNIRKRLKLLYPQKHKLDIRETPQTFCVKLNIDL